MFLLIVANVAVNPGLKSIWDDEKQRRRELERSSQITAQASQERPVCASTKSEVFYQQRLLERILSSKLEVRFSFICMYVCARVQIYILSILYVGNGRIGSVIG